MTRHDAFDAWAPTPALVVAPSGEIAWTNAAARPLLRPGVLDAAARRSLARLAAARTEGVARIRVLSPEGPRLVAVRARRTTRDGAPEILFEAMEPLGLAPDEPEPATAAAPAASPSLRALAVDPRIDFMARVAQAQRAARHPHVEEAPAPEVAAEAAVEEPAPAPAEADAPIEPAPAVYAAEEQPAAEVEPEPVEPEAAPAVQPSAAQDLRFVFELDAAGRIAFLSPDLAAAVGRSAEAALGRPWSEVAEELALDPDGAVAERIARPEVWSDVPVRWPDDRGARLPILLSALPMFDQTRAFVGFRGFGRAVGAAEAPEPEVPEPEAAEPDVVAEEAPAPTAASAPDLVEDREEALAVASSQPEADPAPAEEPAPSRPDTVFDISRMARDRYEPPAIVPAPPATEVFSGNVVPLRDQRAAPAAPQAANARSSLSSVEEDAFDEISRLLKAAGVPVTRPGAPAELAPGLDSAALPAPAKATLGWTLDDVEGRAPIASRLEDVMRLLDRLPVGALVLRAGKIAHANRAVVDMTGHQSLAELVARGAEDLFAPPLPMDDAAPSAVRIVAADGLEVEVEARLSAIAWEGAPATLVSLKRLEGAPATAFGPQQREKEMAEILDTATDGVMTLDAAGRILSVNRSAEALFGVEGAEMIGRPFTLSLAPESRRVAFDYLNGLKANGVAAALNDGREVLGLAAQGGAIPLYLTIGRLGPAENVRYCAVLRDITHWKRAEEELLAAKRQAERANAQKSEFLARVGHEIRTPLNAIIGFSEVMLEERFGPVGSPRYKDYLKDIHAAGDHLLALLRDLLDLAKVESGALQLDFASIDLNEVVSQASALMQPQANRERVIIRTSLARNLPPVLADRRTLRQALGTLLATAVKASRAGGQVIVATAFTDSGDAVVRVRDAGVGMSKKDLARALEPFRPLGAEDADGVGGISLPLAKALTEANGATFAATSDIGQGTLIELVFPAARVLAG